MKLALSATTSDYKYMPLNVDAHEIRLLRLLPGTFSSDIRICLDTIRFTKDHVPDFEALSYAWGSSANPVNIFIGESSNRTWSTLAVTKNLNEALPYLRYENESRSLWIDAICVNQQDLEERSSQVKRMADIYSNARRVLVWIGPESNGSLLALECLRKLSSKVEMDWALFTMSPLSDDLHWADTTAGLPFTDEELLEICNFLNRDWFKRLWIWQEVRLAKNALVICGAESIPWMDVRAMVLYIRMKPKRSIISENIQPSHRELLVRLCQPRALVFTELIDWTKHSVCSDPRDRIFALMSMLNHTEETLKIEPDYSKSTSKVYRDFVSRFIRSRRRLHILTTVESVECSEGILSWTPNWSVPRNTSALVNGHAGSYSVASATFVREGILQVTGAAVSTIAVAEPFSVLQQTSSSEIMNELRRMARRINLKGYVSEKPQNLRDSCRVLISNQFSSAYFPSRLNFSTAGQGESLLGRALKQPPEECEDNESFSAADEAYLRGVRTYCSGRSLFRSIDGHIGIAPKEVKIGDLVTSLLGCNSAMVFRPVQHGKYLVVGEACCSRIMDGAAFLGPLPDSFELVKKYCNQDKGDYWAFADRESGKLQVEDPRLAGVRLPAGWRRKKHPGEEFWTWFVNDETREDNGYFDPRLNLDELKSRGVELEVFDLI